MLTKSSAIDPAVRAYAALTEVGNRISDEIQAMTWRTTAVAGGLIGAVIPLAQFSFENPIKGIIIAAMLPTPTVRRLLCKAAGIQPR